MQSRDMIVDLDSFFASVEQQLRPELRGKPVGIVPVMTDSTCCIAASKEAKAFGVKTGTGVREARQKCPGIHLVESRPEVYLEFHHRFFSALEVWVPVSEVMSIDEVKCRLPESVRTREDAQTFVQRLKSTLALHMGDVVTYSVGIGPNPFLAKLASDMGKPDGCTILEKEELPHALHDLELSDFCGIGRNMEKRLHDGGITTVQQLTSATRDTLHSIWGGINGHYMWHWLRGDATEPPLQQRRSLGHSHVLPTNLRNERGVHAVCHRLLQKAAMRLRKLNYYATQLSMYVKYIDGYTWSREVGFTETQDTFVFLEAFEKLWKQMPKRTGVPPQATGVNFAPIIPAHRVTPDFLLHDPRHAALFQAMDGINKRYGKNTLTFGGALGALQYTPMRIAFTRIPDQETEGRWKGACALYQARYTGLMHDSRIDSLARQLVRYSTQVKKGDRVLLDIFDAPNSITIALIREVVAAKGIPMVKIHDSVVTRELMKHADPVGYDLQCENNLAFMKEMDAYIAIRGSHNITEMSDVPAEKMKMVMEKMRPVINERVNNTKWCVLRWPTSSMAQQAGMSTEAFEDFYFRVCLLDYKSLLPAMGALKKLMDKTNNVHIKGPGTDLRFSLKGLKAIACGGNHNIPDGEVFSAPVKDSVEGYISYNAPTVYQGIAFDSVRLEFSQGKIVKATANNTKAINKILDSDEGARYIGEFAIGFNQEIREPMRDILFDEKIAGSFHFTPGQAYEGVADNGNRSQVHWDLVNIQRKDYGGGEIWFDGKLIRKDGKFIPKDLQKLN